MTWSVLSTPARGHGGESAAAAAALEPSRCYGSGGTVHAREQQEAARVRKSRLPSGSRKQLCFCLIQSQSLYKYLYFSLIIIGINNYGLLGP